MMGVAVCGVERVVLVNQAGKFYTEGGLVWTIDIKDAKVFLDQGGLKKVGELQQKLNAGGPLVYKIYNETDFLN